ncbi:hypothetical protein ACQP2E_13660 [Actinoplanes sp. CA-015351]|uniref:hypothetical protein n=1 Tax=Actinoplanes sp. CA-015351 TaxID=3239897 RepID=UPI003D95F5C5
MGTLIAVCFLAPAAILLTSWVRRWWHRHLRAESDRAWPYRGRMSTRDAPAQIGDLPPLGRSATSAFLAAGITTLAQVSTHSRRDLLSLHGVGPKAIKILTEALSDRGLTFTE